MSETIKDINNESSNNHIALELKNVSHWYGSRQALKSVSLKINRNETRGINARSILPKIPIKASKVFVRQSFGMVTKSRISRVGKAISPRSWAEYERKTPQIMGAN